jgi:hypothetical protein
MPTLADQSRSLAGKMGAVGHTVLDYFLGPKTRTAIDAQGNPVQQPLSTGQRVGNLVTAGVRGAIAGAAQRGPGATGRAALAGFQMGEQQREEAANTALRNQQMIRTALDLQDKNLDIGIKTATLAGAIQDAKDAGDTEVGRFKTNKEVGDFLNNSTPDQTKEHAAGLANSDPSKSYRVYFDPKGGFVVMSHDKADDDKPIGAGDHPLYQFNITTGKDGKQTGSLDVKGQAPDDMTKGKFHDWNQQEQSKLGKFQSDQAALKEKQKGPVQKEGVDDQGRRRFGFPQPDGSFSSDQAGKMPIPGFAPAPPAGEVPPSPAVIAGKVQETRAVESAKQDVKRQYAAISPGNMLVGSMPDGSQVAGTQDELQRAGATGVMKLDADNAKKTIISRQLIAPSGLFALVNNDLRQLDQSGKLGVVASRWSDFMAGKVGSEPEFTKLRTHMGLLATALMQAHVGARGSNEMLEHFKSLADYRISDGPTLRSALGAEYGYVKEKAMLPKKPLAPPAAGGTE